jgi:hypothetical protein
MESKFRERMAEKAKEMDERQRQSGMPDGLGSQALADLTRHTLSKIDTVMHDAVDLLDESYDRFKLMAAIAASVLNRFGNGPLVEVMPEELLALPESKRRHAIIDCINTLTIEPEDLTDRERAVGVVLKLCLSATYGSDKGKDKTLALLEALLRSK